MQIPNGKPLKALMRSFGKKKNKNGKNKNKTKEADMY